MSSSSRSSATKRGLTRSWSALTWNNVISQIWYWIIFYDLENHWSKPHVYQLYNYWVFDKNSNFYPDNNLTRTELIKIALKSFWYWINRNLSNEDLKSIDFADIDMVAWYAPYLVSAVKAWIIDRATSEKIDIKPINIPYSSTFENNVNMQKIFNLLWYSIPLSWEYDFITINAIIDYQKKNWINPDWLLWDKVISKIHSESKIAQIINNWGYRKSLFRPFDHVTRAEASKVILNAAKFEDIWYWTYEDIKFIDVDSNSWYSKYMLYAASKWIVKWYQDLSVDPWWYITRWQMSAITSRTLDVLNEDNK